MVLEHKNKFSCNVMKPSREPWPSDGPHQRGSKAVELARHAGVWQYHVTRSHVERLPQNCDTLRAPYPPFSSSPPHAWRWIDSGSFPMFIRCSLTCGNSPASAGLQHKTKNQPAYRQIRALSHFAHLTLSSSGHCNFRAKRDYRATARY